MTQENSTIDISKILDSEEIRTRTIEAVIDIITRTRKDYLDSYAFRDNLKAKIRESIGSLVDEAIKLELSNLEDIRNIVRQELIRSVRNKLSYLEKKGHLDVSNDEQRRQKWLWMMEYCKDNRIPPAQVVAWNMAEEAYKQYMENQDA